MNLDIIVTKKRDYVYAVSLKGSIDGATYEELEGELKEIIDSKAKAAILDMSDVSYISSIGIRVIMSTKKALTAIGASFTMVNLQPQIKKVFDVMKILPMFDIFNDMPEADKYIDQMIKEEMEKQSV
ncbi:MAG: STAS domain-containing protein [Candidatus Omnitrophota bacterium]